MSAVMFWVVERILLSCCFLAEKMNKQQQQQQKTTNKKKKHCQVFMIFWSQNMIWVPTSVKVHEMFFACFIICQIKKKLNCFEK